MGPAKWLGVAIAAWSRRPGAGKAFQRARRALSAAAAPSPPSSPPAAASGATRDWQIRFCPGTDLMRTGTNPLLLLRELRQLGSLRIKASMAAIPPLGELDPERCYISWDMVLSASAPREAIADVFIFVADSCELTIEPATEPAAASAEEASSSMEEMVWNLVEFRRLNFMDADFGLSQKADVIFCRNVIIYFVRPRQEDEVVKAVRQLVPGGTPSSATPRPRHGCPIGAGRTGPLQENQCWNFESEVSDVYLHPESRTSLASRPSSGRFSAPASASHSGVGGSAPAPMPRPAVAPVPGSRAALPKSERRIRVTASDRIRRPPSAVTVGRYW